MTIVVTDEYNNTICKVTVPALTGNILTDDQFNALMHDVRKIVYSLAVIIGLLIAILGLSKNATVDPSLLDIIATSDIWTMLQAF
jgi:hypothetical protein